MSASSVVASLRAAPVMVILTATISMQARGQECSAEQKSFSATADGGATASRDLIVAGKVQCPSTGWKVHLARAQGNNPRDLVLKLEAMPPEDMAGQIVSDVDVQYLIEDSSAFQNVTIEGGGLDFTIPVVHEE